MDINWISFGKCWYLPPKQVKYPKPPTQKLINLGKKQFGKTPDDYLKELGITDELFDEFYSLIGPKDWREKAEKNPKYSKVFEWIKFRDEFNSWLDATDIAKEYSKKVEAAYKVSKQNESFCGQELNKSGTLIAFRVANDETRTVRYSLIGELNTAGGVCEDCPGIYKEDIVEKYAVIFDMDKFRKEELF